MLRRKFTLLIGKRNESKVIHESLLTVIICIIKEIKVKKIIIALLVVLMLIGTYATISVEEKYVPIKCININELSILPYEIHIPFKKFLKICNITIL